MAKTQTTPRIPISNKLSVLELVSRYESITRREIAHLLHYTPMTISNTVTALIQDGLLVEKDSIKEKGLGRKPNLLDITDKVPLIIGISMTRKTLKCALMDFRSNVIARNETEFRDVKDNNELIGIIRSSVDKLLTENSRPLIAIGFSCFGPVDTRRGRIIDAQFFYGLNEIEIKEPLEAAYGLPVYMIHDANASALAEKYSGAAEELDNFIYIRITAGIGCGLVLNGKIYDGVHGLCGELGHTSINMKGPRCSCGNNGCIENYINTDLITKRINDFHKFNPELTWKDIVALYNSPQEMFKETMSEICDMISYSITNIINILDLDTIFLEYPGQDSGNRIEKNIQEYVNDHIVAKNIRKVDILQSTHREDSTLIGTADLIKSKVFDGEIALL